MGNPSRKRKTVVMLIRKAIRDKKTMPVDVLVSKKHKFNERKMTPTLERRNGRKQFTRSGLCEPPGHTLNGRIINPEYLLYGKTVYD